MNDFNDNNRRRCCNHQSPCFILGPTGPIGPTSNGEKWHTYKIINRIIQYPILTLLETIFLNHSTFLKVL